MPRVRVPIRRSGVRATAVQAPAAGRGLFGGLAGLLLCLLCLATLGLLGLFGAFIALVAYMGDIYRALRSAGNSAPGLYLNMAVLFAALFFALFNKLHRSI